MSVLSVRKQKKYVVSEHLTGVLSIIVFETCQICKLTSPNFPPQFS